MHPTVGYHLAQAHLAGLRHQAQRDTLARAARRARHAHTHQPGHSAAGHPAAAVRRLLTALGARTSV
jgi:hypothetical protein